jgi:hypothetical protein
LKQICATHDFTELKLNNHLLFTFYSVLVLFSRSQDFIPGIMFKDDLRFEERNKNVFFLILRGIWDSTWKKNRRYKNVISPVHLWLVYLQNDTRDYKINTWCFIAPWSPTWIKIFNPHHSPRHDHYHGDWLRYVPFCTVYHDYCALDFWPPSLPQKI